MKIISTALATAYGAAINGFVISKLWYWFLVPLGLPEITLLHSIGIGLFMEYTTHQISHRDEAQKEWGELLFTAVSYTTFYSALTLFLGWIVHVL